MKSLEVAHDANASCAELEVVPYFNFSLSISHMYGTCMNFCFSCEKVRARTLELLLLLEVLSGISCKKVRGRVAV